MGATQSHPTTNKRWTSKEIENNIVRVISKDTNDNATSIDTLGWNDRQIGSGRTYQEYGNDIRDVMSRINNDLSVNDIMDQQTEDYDYVNDVIRNITGGNTDGYELNEIDQLGGSIVENDRQFFGLRNLPDSPLTEMGNNNDVDILRKLQQQVSVDNGQNNLSPTSITPVSDVNIGTFNGTDSALALSMRQPLSVNRLY
jgi:hypothetical protein